jgi:hypothetical protein
VHSRAELPPQLGGDLADEFLYPREGCIRELGGHTVLFEQAVPVGWEDALERPLPEVVVVGAQRGCPQELVAQVDRANHTRKLWGPLPEDVCELLVSVDADQGAVLPHEPVQRDEFLHPWWEGEGLDVREDALHEVGPCLDHGWVRALRQHVPVRLGGGSAQAARSGELRVRLPPRLHCEGGEPANKEFV